MQMLKNWLFCKFIRFYNLVTYRHFIKENTYGLIFENSRRNISWLKGEVFFPSKSAANYSFLYIYLRVLQTVRPKNILELGLGQSTILSGSYASTSPDIKLDVLEDSELWIDLYKNNYGSHKNLNIIHSPLKELKISSTKLNIISKWYDFKPDKKYDLLVIDAPCGTKSYSRVGVLSIIPECLSELFLIIIDDYNVFPTRQTAILIKSTLKKYDIPFITFSVDGTKEQLCIASPAYSFLSNI